MKNSLKYNACIVYDEVNQMLNLWESLCKGSHRQMSSIAVADLVFACARLSEAVVDMILQQSRTNRSY